MYHIEMLYPLTGDYVIACHKMFYTPQAAWEWVELFGANDEFYRVVYQPISIDPASLTNKEMYQLLHPEYDMTNWPN